MDKLEKMYKYFKKLNKSPLDLISKGDLFTKPFFDILI
jgi:hypothetical protein